MIRLAKLVNNRMRSFGYTFGRYHGVERATWLSERRIATVLDIGAHVGLFSTSIRQALPNARIYAFEPNRECFGKLLRVTSDDPLTECLPYALGSKAGSVSFNKNDFAPSSSLLPLTKTHVEEFPYTAKTSTTEVEVERLDSIAPTLDMREPLLVKMDVQGAELHVIEGGRQTLARADVVITEVLFAELYEGQPYFDELYRELYDLGLRFRGVMEQVHGRRNNVPIFCDALFVRAEALPDP